MRINKKSRHEKYICFNGGASLDQHFHGVTSSVRNFKTVYC